MGEREGKVRGREGKQSEDDYAKEKRRCMSELFAGLGCTAEPWQEALCVSS